MLFGWVTCGLGYPWSPRSLRCRRCPSLILGHSFAVHHRGRYYLGGQTNRLSATGGMNPARSIQFSRHGRCSRSDGYLARLALCLARPTRDSARLGPSLGRTVRGLTVAISHTWDSVLGVAWGSGPQSPGGRVPPIAQALDTTQVLGLYPWGSGHHGARVSVTGCLVGGGSSGHCVDVQYDTDVVVECDMTRMSWVRCYPPIACNMHT